MSAAHFDLPNLTAIVDYNHLQTDGTTEEVMDTGDVRAKFEAFGWDAVEIDGHDMGAVVESLERSRTLDRPVRDRLPDQEGPRRLLHGGPLRLPRQAAEPGAGRAGDGGARGDLPAADQGARGGELMASELIEAAEAQTESIATRQAYGDALVALGEAHPEVVALDADLAVSTQSMKFGKQFPERFFNIGAAEANMMSISTRPRRQRQGPLRLDLRDLRHLALLRPGAPRHRPQRAQGPDRRLARRGLPRRGRRLPPDDRGHRADAGDAEDAGGRPRGLQPGLHGGHRVLRALRRPHVHALRPAEDAGRLPGDPRDAGGRRRRPAGGQGHLDLHLRPHGLARARGRRDARARGRGGGRGGQRLDHQADRLPDRCCARWPRRVSP